MINGINRHATLRMMAAASFALCSRLPVATAPRSLMFVSNAGFDEAIRSFNRLGDIRFVERNPVRDAGRSCGPLLPVAQARHGRATRASHVTTRSAFPD